MEKNVYEELEELLNGEDGLLFDLRFGEGLNKEKSKKILDKIDLLNFNDNIPKSFFELIIDSILVITSSLNINNNSEEIMEFLDVFTDKLKNK